MKVGQVQEDRKMKENCKSLLLEGLFAGKTQ